MFGLTQRIKFAIVTIMVIVAWLMIFGAGYGLSQEIDGHIDKREDCQKFPNAFRYETVMATMMNRADYNGIKHIHKILNPTDSILIRNWMAESQFFGDLDPNEWNMYQVFYTEKGSVALRGRLHNGTTVMCMFFMLDEEQTKELFGEDPLDLSEEA